MKLPAIKPVQVVRALQKGGFSIHHQTGSHARLIHRTKAELRVTVPIHSKDLPRDTLRRILQQAQLSLEEFLKLLEG